MSRARRAAGAAADSLPVVLLAVIAGAGSFTHIRDTAAEHGQRGPMSWAIAVCVDLTCVMAARERQRDKRHGIAARRASWPTVVLAAGVLLSLAANLAQAQPTPWGRVMAATPAGAFLIAVSMLERRATLQHRHNQQRSGSPPGQAPGGDGAVPPIPGSGWPVPSRDGVPGGQDGESGAADGVPERPLALPAPGHPPPAADGELAPLEVAARRAAAEHYRAHGQPITRDALRARLGISNQAASELLRQVRDHGEAR